MIGILGNPGGVSMLQRRGRARLELRGLRPAAARSGNDSAAMASWRISESLSRCRRRQIRHPGFHWHGQDAGRRGSFRCRGSTSGRERSLLLRNQAKAHAASAFHSALPVGAPGGSASRDHRRGLQRLLVERPRDFVCHRNWNSTGRKKPAGAVCWVISQRNDRNPASV